MHAWTIFYWGWWISWGPFVGTFLAKISKGRTLGEFVGFSLILPTLYCVLWFGVFGGAGLRMQYRDPSGTLLPVGVPASRAAALKRTIAAKTPSETVFVSPKFGLGTSTLARRAGPAASTRRGRC